MALGISARIANILLDYIFIVLFQMGIKGAAFGTGIGRKLYKWFFGNGKSGGNSGYNIPF